MAIYAPGARVPFKTCPDKQLGILSGPVCYGDPLGILVCNTHFLLTSTYPSFIRLITGLKPTNDPGLLRFQREQVLSDLGRF